MLVWAHHMFTVGMSDPLQWWFMVASFSVAVPTAIKIFNWLATSGGATSGSARPSTSASASSPSSPWAGSRDHARRLSGGLPGADSYYVVAHFHYVLFGGTVFGIFAGSYYWFPKITGRMYDERLARLHFWLMFIGFNAAFLPQHMLGLMGMPRRVYTYEREGPSSGTT